MHCWIVERSEQSPLISETDARHISSGLRPLNSNPIKRIQEHQLPTRSKSTTNLTKKLRLPAVGLCKTRATPFVVRFCVFPLKRGTLSGSGKWSLSSHAAHPARYGRLWKLTRAGPLVLPAVVPNRRRHRRAAGARPCSRPPPHAVGPLRWKEAGGREAGRSREDEELPERREMRRRRARGAGGRAMVRGRARAAEGAGPRRARGGPPW